MTDYSNYYEFLRRVHLDLRPKVYLEIGVHEGHSLAFVGSDTKAIGVDPAPKVDSLPANITVVTATSDDFFARPDTPDILGGPVDLAFIDGLHHYDQTLRDFANTERMSSPDATILIHDCVPIDAVTSARERTTMVWSGDVWKAIVALRRFRPDLTIQAVDVAPTGMAIITGLDPPNRVLHEHLDEILESVNHLTFDDYLADRDGLLSYPTLEYHAQMPVIDDPTRLRRQLKWEVAIGYRIFSKMRWGQLGDGHISARDPERPDHFWVLAHGIPFWSATVHNLVLVGPDGRVVEGPGTGGINQAAHNIHWPVLNARPDLVSAAHTHTQFGTPWSANVTPFLPISQESCVFVFNQSIYRGEDLEVATLAGGEAIAAAMGDTSLCILRNHGMLTGGRSPGEAVGLFVLSERVAEVHVKAVDPKPVSDEAARQVADSLGAADIGWRAFQWLARDLVPDPSVVLS